MKQFINGLLVVFLLAIIIGGVGYLGYNYVSKNPMVQMPNQQQMDSSKGQMPQMGYTQAPQVSNTQAPPISANQTPTANNQNQQSNQTTNDFSKTIVKNSEKLNLAFNKLNDAIKLMSLDPYAPSSNGNMNMGNTNTNTTTAQSTTGNPQKPNEPNKTSGNNNVNIYPQSNSTINVLPNGDKSNNQAQTSMQNMGQTFDNSKMEQLHTGLYNISVGLTLLNKLKEDFASQIENANINLQNPNQYFVNQFNQIVENKNKLTKALGYINQAANFVNINPYISTTGYVFDKDKMNQIHQSVYKLAEAVTELNLLNDEMLKQQNYLSNQAQNYMNQANSNVHGVTNNNLTSFLGSFNNINIATVINIILVIFLIGLIFGILGYIFSLFKIQSKNF